VSCFLTFWISRKVSSYYTAERLASTKIYSTSSPRSYYGSVDGTSIEGWSNSTFEPIPELRRADADTHVIIFHNNGVRFFAPTDDPIFAAHREKRVFFDNNSTETMYTADNPATFLGCTEQVYLDSLLPLQRSQKPTTNFLDAVLLQPRKLHRIDRCRLCV